MREDGVCLYLYTCTVDKQLGRWCAVWCEINVAALAWRPLPPRGQGWLCVIKSSPLALFPFGRRQRACQSPKAGHTAGEKGRWRHHHPHKTRQGWTVTSHSASHTALLTPQPSSPSMCVRGKAKQVGCTQTSLSRSLALRSPDTFHPNYRGLCIIQHASLFIPYITTLHYHYYFTVRWKKKPPQQQCACHFPRI